MTTTMPAISRSPAVADRHQADGRVRLVLVGGLPGTGKSTVSAALSCRYGWPVLRSDVIRKRLSGRGAEPGPARPGGGIYRPAWTAATYAALLEEAECHLRQGQSVILDATWTDPVYRSAAARMARATGAELVPLSCEAPETVTLRRLAARSAAGHDRSDATPAAYRYLADRLEPWADAIRLDTTNPLADTLARAARVVDIAPG
jgi:predicted kinase